MQIFRQKKFTKNYICLLKPQKSSTFAPIKHPKRGASITSPSKKKNIMRRIEFIAPVDAMRGNLSGNQQLRYPTANNAAWDAPANKRSYANNYGTRYVGAKRSKDGHKYFAVKQRSATLINSATKTNMALLAASSVVANILAQDLAVQTSLLAFYDVSAAKRSGWTFKRYLQEGAREGLAAKTHITFAAEAEVPVSDDVVVISNPYINTALPEGGHSINDQYPAELLIKFLPQLSNGGFTFTIVGQTGVSFPNETWAQLIASDHNILGLTSHTTTSSAVVVAKKGSTAESGYTLNFTYGGDLQFVSVGSDVSDTVSQEDPDKSPLFWQAY